MNGLVGQSQAYPPHTASANTPRELGVLARMDSIAIGLQDLQQKLTGFGERLTGGGRNEPANAGHPPGIDGALSAAEARLRECHQLVDALHKAF